MRDRQPQTALYVGIDVSKPTLTIALYPTAPVWDIPNQPDQWQALAAQLQKPPVQRVLLESSGGYEQGVAQTLQQAGLPVMVVPAQRARHFAKSMRGNLKTDRVDAQRLAYLACCYPRPRSDRDARRASAAARVVGASGAVSPDAGGGEEAAAGGA
jgi:transposase